MQFVKKLSACGNSFAITIDRPILRLLGIGPNTRLRLSTDGRRLIVDPLEPDRNASVLNPTKGAGTLTVDERIDARAMYWSLIHHYSMCNTTFGRLHPSGSTSVSAMLRYQVSLDMDLDTISAEETATIKRFWECFRVLRDKGRWEDAIRIALERFPL